jgi:hypothetical protein
MRAFFERIRARRGPQIAATAIARKLVVLFWHLLTNEQDYAFARPAMTHNKIRRLELLAGAPPQKGRKGIAGNKSKALYETERELSRQAEATYQRLVSDWRSSRPPTTGAGATPGRIFQPLAGQSRAADSVSPTGLRFATSITRTQEKDPTSHSHRPLDAMKKRAS